MPEWADCVKLGRHNELGPIDDDWFYTRAGNFLVLERMLNHFVNFISGILLTLYALFLTLFLSGCSSPHLCSVARWRWFADEDLWRCVCFTHKLELIVLIANSYFFI